MQSVDLAKVSSAEALGTLFEDIEELQKFTRMKGWDLRFVQLSPGNIFFGHRGIEVPSGYFSLHFQSPSTLHLYGTAPEAYATIILPLGIGRTFRYMGRHLTGADAIIVKPTQEVDLLLDDQLQYAAIYLKKEAFRAISSIVYGPVFGSRASTPPSVFGGPSVVELKRRISVLFRNEAIEPMSRCSAGSRRKSAGRVISQLVTALSQQTGALNEGHVQESDHKQSHARRARVVMEANRHDPLTLSDLSAQLGVSVRTLQYLFQDLYGISPAKYDALWRLSGAYSELKRADPSETSVTAVATNWGFYHFGRFSRTFQTQFGELPSLTLAARPARIF